MKQLEITITAQGGCRVLDVAGEIDLCTVDQFGAALEYARIRATPLIADLADVEFCDASGLGALITAHNRSRVWGASLGIVASRPVNRVIDLTHTHAILRVYRNRRRALAAIPLCDVRALPARADRVAADPGATDADPRANDPRSI